MKYFIDHPLVLEIANRCNDTHYDDFQKNSYLESIYRAEKRIALKYDILNRVLFFKNKIVVPPQFEGNVVWLQTQKETSIDLPVTSFHNETNVTINSIQYTKVSKDKLITDDDYPIYSYHLYYGNNSYKFNYTERGIDDVIIISFTSDINISDYEEENIRPILPPKFEDEVINRACTDMAKKGITMFKGDKADKFYKILKMYSKEKVDIDVTESRSWITIKPWQPL